MALLGLPKPVTVTIEVPQARADVYAYLDVMANHEAFTDHMLKDWRLSGPPSGVGSAATVRTELGAVQDEARIEVFEVEDGRRIAERNVSAKGKRTATGTYLLEDAPGGGTRISFTAAFEKVPFADRLAAPLARSLLRRGNDEALRRLAEQLAATPAR